jgi:putative transposase
MLINKAYSFRLYPAKSQAEMLTQHFGSCRFVYNRFLRERVDFYAANKGTEKQGLTYNDTAKMLTVLKKNPDFVWLNAVNAQSLQHSLRRLDVAYHNFFNKKAQFPKFKSRHDKQSFHVPQAFHVDVGKGVIRIPKFAPIKAVFHRPIEGEMKSVTISRTTTGKYFASILCEADVKVKPKRTGPVIGMDLGLKSFLVTSDGERVEAPKFLRASERKLKRRERCLSRKVKGSNNRNKARHKVALIHEKIANQRKDFLHKLSTRLAGENQAIFAEDLNVKGMTANHRIAKSVCDAGWSEFIRQVEYKSEWVGTLFGQIDRFFPSSKRHYACGWINDRLTLNDREWICGGCGALVDRDHNAAQNIRLFGLKQMKQMKQIASDRRESTLSEKRRTKALH